MKKLLGILFCFGFLLTAGTVHAQSEATQTQITVGQEIVTVCDCIKMVQADIVSVTDIQNISTPRKSFAIDMYKLRQASKQAASKASEALFYRYGIVPDCPVIYIRKPGGQYYNHYCYCVTCNYNQPPNYNI